MLVCSAIATTYSMGVPAQEEEGTLEIHGIEITPAIVTANQPFEITVTGYHLDYGSWSIRPNFLIEELDVELQGDQIVVFDFMIESCGSPTFPPPPNDSPARRIFALPGFPEGDYILNVEILSSCAGASVIAERPLKIYATSGQLKVGQEAPSFNQTVSGVGLIRGWACYDRSVEEVGWNSPAEGSIPYGSSRKDTASVCGEGNTLSGYGAVVYWGVYGEGQHTFTLYVDGEQQSSFPFRVVAPEEGFMTGLDAEYELQDFPAPGDRVKVRWSQADQNFIVVEYQ